jgi:hypothetical protein
VGGSSGSLNNAEQPNPHLEQLILIEKGTRDIQLTEQETGCFYASPTLE